jgi:hypothetical protein
MLSLATLALLGDIITAVYLELGDEAFFRMLRAITLALTAQTPPK